jgi:hypothetical protein
VPPQVPLQPYWFWLRGNKEKAVWYWKRVVEFWKDCAPELRPKLEEAEARLAALHGR